MTHLSGSVASPSAYEMQQLLLLDKPLEEDGSSDDSVGNIDHSPKRQRHTGDRCVRCGGTYGEAPGLLSCLHIVCKACRSIMISEAAGDRRSSPAGDTRPLSPMGTNSVAHSNKRESIHCPKCKQATLCGHIEILVTSSSEVASSMSASADAYEKDHEQHEAAAQQLASFGCSELTLVCTSCKAKEAAVARCCDCDSFICPNCVAAHHYMRCFEDHKVLPLAKNDDRYTAVEQSLSSTSYRARRCSAHPQELLKLFCRSCQVPACELCAGAGGAHAHRAGAGGSHQCERLSSAVEQREAEDLASLVGEARSKVQLCADAGADLQTALTGLQSQRDDAKSRLFETLQSYKAILDRRHEALLRELEEAHGEHELAVMDSIELLNRTVEQIEDGCFFAERVLKRGDGRELIFLKKMIASQLLSLINNLPKCDEASYSRLAFHTDPVKFTAAVEVSFGFIKSHNSCRRGSSVSPGSSCHAQDEAASVSPAALLDRPFDAGSGSSSLLPADSLLAGLPPSVQSSQSSAAAAAAAALCGNLGTIGSSLLPSDCMGAEFTGSSLSSIDHMLPGVQQLPPQHEPASAAAYLRDLANALSAASTLGCNPSVAERTLSRQSLSPTMSDSGIGMDAPAGTTASCHLSGAAAAQVHLAELAVLSKIGNITLGPQGQVLVNGQPLQGIGIAHLSNLQGGHPTRSAADSDMAAIGGPVLGGALAGMRPDVSCLEGLTSLAAQQSSQLQHPTQPSGGAGTPPSQSMVPPPGAGAILGASSSRAFSPIRHQPVLVRSQSKMAAMQIRCKFGQLGPGRGQFNSPHGFCLGCDEDIIVADTNNHRIQVFDKTGEFKYQFGVPGREEGQLWYPRKVAVMRSSGRFVVCDRGNERSRMQIFTKSGHFLKKIAIRYIDIVAGLAITSQGNIVAVDSVSPTVFCISEAGDLVKWFDCSDYMREPSDIAISGKEYFVCDFKGHCVVVFNEDGLFLRRIGTDVITNFPNGIDISDAGDILVGDSHGNRFHVAVFQREGILIGEFECPYVKVSRCCGLKITSEGHVVTLAKNNHHVLILNTLYIA